MNKKDKIMLLSNFNQIRGQVILLKSSSSNSHNLQTNENEFVDSNSKALTLLKVSKLSFFLGDEWDFNEDPDSKNVSRESWGSRLKINFSKFSNIPIDAIIELKCIMYLFYLAPSLFHCKGRKKKTYKPNSLVVVFTTGLNFINALYEGLESSYGKEYVQNELNSLEKIDRTLFERTAANYKFVYRTDLKIFLDNLAHPKTKEVLGHTIACEFSEEFEWLYLPSGKIDNKSQIVKGSNFRCIVRFCTYLVSDFLFCVSEKITVPNVHRLLEDSISQTITPPSSMGLTSHSLSIYSAMRLKSAGYLDNEIINIQTDNFGEERVSSRIFSKHQKIASYPTLRKRLVDGLANINYTVNEFMDLLALIKYSAQYLIALYMGARPSEFFALQLDCIDRSDYIPVIQSEIKKGVESVFNGLFDEKWVLTPVMEDSVKALQILSIIYQNSLLFSNIKTVKPGRQSDPMMCVSLAHQHKKLISLIFDNKLPAGLNFNAYHTRHTLSYHLYQAGLGLPYISYQLKHLVNRVEKFTAKGAFSAVTLGYGSIGDELTKGQGHVKKIAELDYIKSIMSPDGKYAGGMKAEHKQKLVKFFEGYMARGYSEEEVYEALLEQGIPIVNMGVGMCYVSRRDASNESLPCIGSLKCNPTQCKHSLICKSNQSKWLDILESNLSRLKVASNSEEITALEATVTEAKNVLIDLGTDLSHLDFNF